VGYQVRKARRRDLKAAYGLQAQLVGIRGALEILDDVRHYYSNRWVALKVLRGRALVAVDGGAPVGILTWGTSKGGLFHIETVVVDGRHRGRGAGTCLVRGAEASAAKLGCRSVRIASHKVFKAKGFYTKMGYRCGPLEDDQWVLRKNLTFPVTNADR